LLGDGTAAGAGGGGEADDHHDDGDDDPLDCLRAYDRHVLLQPDDAAQFLFLLQRNDTYKGRTMPIAAGTSLGYVMTCVRIVSKGQLWGTRLTPYLPAQLPTYLASYLASYLPLCDLEARKGRQ
jgi:hypothetical protein